MSTTHDVIIAGGSHAGLALALALSHLAGPELRIALVERRNLASDVGGGSASDPRAFAIAAGSRHLLQRLGVWELITRDAEPVHTIDITDSRLADAIRPVGITYDNHIAGGAPATHIVPADQLAAALLDRARAVPGLQLLSSQTISAFTVDAAAVRVSLSSGAEHRASLLVAADGARSAVRQVSGIKTVTWNPGQVALVAVVAHDRPHQGRAVQHFLPCGPFAILPMTGNRSCITWTEDATRGREIAAASDVDFLAEAQRRFGWKLGAIRIAGGRALWPLDLHVARGLVARRVALIGDAARTVHPIAGQGVNLAFKDAAALAETITDAMRVGLDAGDMTALERYESWRRFDATMATASFNALNALFSTESDLLRAARGVGLGIVDRLPALKHLLVSEAAGLTGEIPRLLQASNAPPVDGVRARHT